MFELYYAKIYKLHNLEDVMIEGKEVPKVIFKTRVRDESIEGERVIKQFAFFKIWEKRFSYNSKM